jgi:energy-coupling factor transporter ATP-binding protein EcfA2
MTGGEDRPAQVWKQLLRRPGSRIERITVESSPVLASGGIDLDQLTVFTGPHGVGKSYLLRIIEAALPHGHGDVMGAPFSWFDRRDEVHGRLGGRYLLSYSRPGVAPDWLIDFARPHDSGQPAYEYPGEDTLWSAYVEPSSAMRDYDSYFSETRYGRHPPMSAPNALKKAEIEYLRDILGRRYESFTWQDVPIGGEVFTPRLEARESGRLVTNETMSMGELWVHYCLWRLRTADADCIVIIDEPETFLSPAGHAAFLDEIARLTLASGAQTIIATHSAGMIMRTPVQLLRELIPNPAGTRVRQPASPVEVLHHLGHEPELTGIVLAEDDLAKRAVAAILARLDPRMAQQVDIIDSGGKDNALSAGRVLARSARLGACVVLDGDQRHAEIKDYRAEVAYLPGGQPEESILAPVQAHPSLLAKTLGASEDDVALALDKIRFQAHQYWFSRIAQALGRDEPAIAECLISIWLRDQTVQAQARELAEQIRDACSTHALPHRAR